MSTKWYDLINPCDMDRYKGLAPIGDALAKIFQWFTAGTECSCCLGARVVFLAGLSFVSGAVLL